MALGKTLQETAIYCIKKFKEAGAVISFDVNYRATLWDEDTARETILKILPLVDILFVSEETSRRMFKKEGSLNDIMKSYSDEFGCKIVATTKREVISPTKHNFSSQIYYNGEFYTEKAYENIEVIDRVGSGDAYVAGVLYGIIKHGCIKKALEIGNAMSAVKNTVSGDMSASSINEIEDVIKSHHAVGKQSEMNR